MKFPLLSCVEQLLDKDAVLVKVLSLSRKNETSGEVWSISIHDGGRVNSETLEIMRIIKSNALN